MEDETRYFTFPICLLKLEGITIRIAMNNVMDYCIYAYIRSNFGKPETYHTGNVKAAAEYYGITLGNDKRSYENGKELFNSIELRYPKTSITKAMLFDYYKNHKTEFETVVFLAFAAIKSTLQTKPYFNLKNAYLLARMAGKAKVDDTEPLPEYLKLYDVKRYHLDKVKKELRNNWHLKIYGYKTRGFYVSLKLTLGQLILQVEGQRKSNVEKKYQQEIAELRAKAIEQLNSTNVKKPQQLSEF